MSDMTHLDELEAEAIYIMREVAAECEKVGITSNAEVLPAAIKNSNLRFTRIAECTDDYNTYFKLIDQASTNEQGEYDSLFIEK